MPVHLTCPTCASSFTRPPNYVRAHQPPLYCKRECSKRREIASCKACGAPFERRTKKTSKRSYCSLACHDRRAVPVEVRFWRYVEKDGPIPEHASHLGPCWLWTGSADAGYGKIETWSREAGAGSVKAHRLSLSMALGRPIAAGLKVLHHCDVKRCVNPAHLYEGTTQDNSDDAVERDRMPRGERHPHARFTEAMVRDMHALYATGWRQVDIAAKYGTSQPTVSHILLGKSWRHICES